MLQACHRLLSLTCGLDARFCQSATADKPVTRALLSANFRSFPPFVPRPSIHSPKTFLSPAMSLFGQSSGSSLFGQPQQQQQQNASPFGNTNTNTTQQKPSLFGSLNTNTVTSQPQQQGGGLFGSTTQPAQGGGTFGAAQPQQPGAAGGLFQIPQTQQPPVGGGLFGQGRAPTQEGGGLFGSSQPQQQQGGGLFGSTQPQQQQQQQQQQGSGLFGSLGATNNQQPQQQQQQQQNQQQQQGSILGQSRLFQQSELTPRKLPPKVPLFGPKETKPLPTGQKPVIEQIELAYTKWNPMAPTTPFRTYLYNAVQPESVPFYGPTPQDDEAKWEEALAKRPIPGSIPILVRGFEELGNRVKSQYFSLGVLQGRLHEINDGLNTLLQSMTCRSRSARRSVGADTRDWLGSVCI